MRELNFSHDIDYRTFVRATFTDGHERWEEDVIICDDYDEDDDVGYKWFRTFADLECADGYVSSHVVGRSRN